MNIINTIPEYSSAEERAIMVQNVYLQTQKELQNRKNRKKGDKDDRDLCTSISRQER